MSKGSRKFTHEVFLDRTHGKRLGAILRGAGFNVHPIYEVYPNETHKSIADPVWLKLCAEQGWIVVTGDKRLETVPENRQAVIETKARVFLLQDSNSPPEVWAAAVIVGSGKMEDILDANTGPFFVNIAKRADGHVGKLRYPPGYSEAKSQPVETTNGFTLTAPDMPEARLENGTRKRVIELEDIDPDSGITNPL